MIEVSRTMPTVDPDLLLAHIEYSEWAVQKTLDMVDKLPAEAVAKRVESSFPSIFATLQHVYHGDKYHFTFMKGVIPNDFTGVPLNVARNATFNIGAEGSSRR